MADDEIAEQVKRLEKYYRFWIVSQRKGTLSRNCPQILKSYPM